MTDSVNKKYLLPPEDFDLTKLPLIDLTYPLITDPNFFGLRRSVLEFHFDQGHLISSIIHKQKCSWRSPGIMRVKKFTAVLMRSIGLQSVQQNTKQAISYF